MSLATPEPQTSVFASLFGNGARPLGSGEELFCALAAHTPVGIFVSSAGGSCEYVNDRWCELTGLTPEQARGDGWTVALHPDDAERVRAEWREAAAAGRDSIVEYRFRRPDGSVSWIQGFATALHDQHGKATNWVGTCLDLTDYKETEEALRCESEHFRAAFDGAPIGMALATPDGDWTQVNQALCNLLGYSAEQLCALNYIDVTHPDDRPKSLEWRRLLVHGSPQSPRFEKRYLRSDGEVIWAAVSSTVVRNEAGEPLYTVSQIEDITQRVQAESALQEAEERFRRAFDDAPIGMALVATDGRWLRVNKALCAITGYSEDELLARTFQEITHPDDLEADLEHARLLQSGSIRHYHREKRYVRADGEIVWVMLSVSLVRDQETDEPLYGVTQIEDITERVRTQTALREAEERFRRAFDDAPIGMALVATDGRWLRVNKALCAITGYSEDELLVRTFQDITHPDDLDSDVNHSQLLLSGGTRSYRMEKRYVRADGQAVWVMLSVSLVRDLESGDPLYFVSQVEDISDRKRAAEELRQLADHDALTGLLNRRALESAFSQAATRYRSGRSGALFLIDIDDFKVVNDTVGHTVGDRVLVRFAELLMEWTRPGDLVGRFAGDEFVVFVSTVSEPQVMEIAQRLIEQADNLRFEEGEHRFDLRISVGVCLLDSSTSSDVALSRAETALYQAKERGKHRAVAWSPSGSSAELLSLASGWAVRIKDALRDDQLTYELQPIFDLGTGEIAFFEALVRIRDGDQLTPPSTFLPVAERFGLMPQIDRWMIDAVLKLLRSRTEPTTIFVNLSALSLADESLIDFVKSELSQHQLGSHKLGFEVTERTAIADLTSARHSLSELEELGCPIALDDFGVDFASFEHLRELPVSIVKIGQPFVPRLHWDPADRAIVRSIIEVSHALGRRVVVERIEEPSAARIVQELGAEYGQGFWWGPPASVQLALGLDGGPSAATSG